VNLQILGQNFIQSERPERTHLGEGHFRKDYTASASSEDYKKGWDDGRAYCQLIVPEEAKPGMRTQYQQSIDEKKAGSR